MAVYDLEEQERIDALKDWWETNRAVILGVTAVVVLAVAGYFGWQQYRVQQLVKAESLHKEFVKATDTREPAKIVEAARRMTTEVPGSFHATSAAFAAGKAAFDAKDFAAARQNLEWVIQNGQKDLRPLAGVRLAQVLLEDKKYDDALKVLDGVKADGFAALAADIRGDVLMAKGSKEEARLAWQQAVDKAGDRSPVKQLAQIKLDSVGGVSK